MKVNPEAERLKQDLLYARRAPARTDKTGAGIVLGMTANEIRILVSAKLLKPLGSPDSRAGKYFSTAEHFDVGRDSAWLGKATKAIQENWRKLNQNKKPLAAIEAET